MTSYTSRYRVPGAHVCAHVCMYTHSNYMYLQGICFLVFFLHLQLTAYSLQVYMFNVYVLVPGIFLFICYDYMYVH